MPLPIQIDYYTDPLCSWCYAMEDTLERMKSSFSDRISINYKMFPLYEDLQEVMSPLRLWTIADRWVVVGKKTRLFIDSKIWYEDPPMSAWLPCMAFKAAESLSKEKAEAFLKLMRVAAMTQRKNIARTDVQLELAEKVGLERTDFHPLIQNVEIKKQVELDVLEGERHGVEVRPTLIFSNAQGDRVMTSGLRSYSLFEQAIETLDAE